MLIQKIHQRTLEAARKYKRAESDLLGCIIEVDQNKVFRKLGYGSLFEYIVNALQLSEAVAYNFSAVARKSIEIPELKKAIDQGNLTVSKARKVTSVLTQENKFNLIKMAETLTQNKLEREVAKINPRATTPEKIRYVSGNRVEISLGGSEKLALKLRQIQNLVSQAKRRNVSLEEALEEITDLYLLKKDPLRKARRQKVRNLIKKPVARQVSQNQGKRTPIAAAIIQEVDLRDQRHCIAKSPDGKRCASRRHLHYHHLKPVSKGGEHSLSNLITLCSVHHREIHERAIAL